VYAVCRQTQLRTRWYANLLNVNLNYMFWPQSLAIIRLYKRKHANKICTQKKKKWLRNKTIQIKKNHRRNENKHFLKEYGTLNKNLYFL
jgi:hypothetical protein